MRYRVGVRFRAPDLTSYPKAAIGSALYLISSAHLKIFAALVISYALVKFSSLRRRRRLPPGPRGLPILGNIFDIPSRDEWKAYQSWGAERNSDIISLDMAGTPMIVLNSREAAHDLLEKRSAVYSDRPRYVMLNELCGFGWDFNFQPYGSEWKDRRKLFTRELQPPKSLQHRPRVQAAIRSMLKKLDRKPEAFISHLRHMAGEIILSIAYGIEILEEDDPHVKLSEAGLVAIAKAANWGSYAVDYLPWLRHLPGWLPGMGFKREAARWKLLSEAMVRKPFEYAETMSRKGEATMSLASAILEDMNEEDTASREVLRDTLGAMYEAGADTTVSGLSTFILAMVLYPEVQRTGRTEIEKVIGRSRLPTFEDDKSIPYVDAIVKEVLRWRPVTPLALPHRLERDDEYKGYHIPAGSVVVGNTWAMLHNKRTYGEDTEAFRPERFLKDGKIDDNVPHPDAAFGFGRRACPGQDVAWSSMWLAVASILICFEISEACAPNGDRIRPSGRYSSGMQIYPEPFVCMIRARSREILEGSE